MTSLFDSSYTCCMCKGTFEGKPARANAAGQFCKGCSEEMVRRMRASSGPARVPGQIVSCGWCGCERQVKLRSNGDFEENTCEECEKHRKWLLRSIRYSHRPFLYVTRHEAVEKPAREQRARLAEKPQVPAVPAARPAGPDRLDRLEQMVSKLIDSLGGVP